MNLLLTLVIEFTKYYMWPTYEEHIITMHCFVTYMDCVHLSENEVCLCIVV